MGRRSEGAFSMMEVLASLLVFSVGAMGVATTFVSQMAINTKSEVRSGAIIAVNQVLDELRVSSVNALPTSGRQFVRSVTVGTRAFDVYVTYCRQNEYCTSSSVRQLHAEARLKGSMRYEVDTVFAQLR